MLNVKSAIERERCKACFSIAERKQARDEVSNVKCQPDGTLFLCTYIVLCNLLRNGAVHCTSIREAMAYFFLYFPSSVWTMRPCWRQFFSIWRTLLSVTSAPFTAMDCSMACSRVNWGERRS